MIEIIEGLPDNCVGLTATGAVTGEDYEKVLVPAVEATLAKHDKIRLLYHLGEKFESFQARAMWDDAKIGLKHPTAWERVAVVTDVSWLRGAVHVFGFAIPGEVKVFDNDEFAQAREWIVSF